MTSLAIVQVFNQPFRRVESSLPRLQRLGFTHVLVSPPQKSHASRSWWGRYQPVDFRMIEGPLGDREDLERLCRAASQRGLAIMADAVLGHMSNEPRYVRSSRGRLEHAQFPRFSTPDFEDRLDRSHGRGRGLAALRTKTSWVRQELRDYLHMLHGLGVRGFRFDAAKHIEPDFFLDVLSGLPGLLCFGELVLADAASFPGEYFKSMKAWDFPLAHTLKRAFAHGGDLGILAHPSDRGQALWGPVAVTFVNNHDLIRNRRAMDFFRVADSLDRSLAYLYILARQDGIPCVYAGDLRDAHVRTGLAFHRLAGSQSTRWLHVSRNCLMWSRGPSLLAAINKSGSTWAPGSFECGLAPGRYRNLFGGSLQQVDQSGRWLDCAVPARGAVLLVRS